jgi:pimeloyl-ACP methyl ester carboxylesterase
MRAAPSLSRTSRSIMPHMRSTLRWNVIQAAPTAQASVGDGSCTPEDTLPTAQRIPGAQVTAMRDLGHFPMSESPAQFRQYILPVLDEIRRAQPKINKRDPSP